MFALTYCALPISLIHTQQQMVMMHFVGRGDDLQSFGLSQKLFLNIHIWKQSAYILTCLCQNARDTFPVTVAPPVLSIREHNPL